KHQTPQLKGPIYLSKTVSFPTLNGCQYSTALRGTIQPAKQGKEMKGADQMVIPNVTQAAKLACPDKPEVKVVERFQSPTPIPVHELEDALSRRGTVAVSVGNKSCVFMPELALQEKSVDGLSLAFLCGVNKVEKKEGGGGGGGTGEEEKEKQKGGEEGKEKEQHRHR